MARACLEATDGRTGARGFIWTWRRWTHHCASVTGICSVANSGTELLSSDLLRIATRSQRRSIYRPTGKSRDTGEDIRYPSFASLSAAPGPTQIWRGAAGNRQIVAVLIPKS